MKPVHGLALLLVSALLAGCHRDDSPVAPASPATYPRLDDVIDPAKYDYWIHIVSDPEGGDFLVVSTVPSKAGSPPDSVPAVTSASMTLDDDPLPLEQEFMGSPGLWGTYHDFVPGRSYAMSTTLNGVTRTATLIIVREPVFTRTTAGFSWVLPANNMSQEIQHYAFGHGGNRVALPPSARSFSVPPAWLTQSDAGAILLAELNWAAADRFVFTSFLPAMAMEYPGPGLKTRVTSPALRESIVRMSGSSVRP
jgi:hypothetical protein